MQQEIIKICKHHNEDEDEKRIYMIKRLSWHGYITRNNCFGWSSSETSSSALPFLKITLILHGTVPCGATRNISKCGGTCEVQFGESRGTEKTFAGYLYCR